MNDVILTAAGPVYEIDFISIGRYNSPVEVSAPCVPDVNIYVNILDSNFQRERYGIFSLVEIRNGLIDAMFYEKYLGQTFLTTTCSKGQSFMGIDAAMTIPGGVLCHVLAVLGIYLICSIHNDTSYLG